ncbi:MAG: helix-turn-helix transcriptional regulator [Parabacteroides sp.]|nr:helix-turn-helix transcriptional regulator [Parabacteroides sp.]
MDTADRIIETIEQILRDKNFSRYKLARASGISQSSIANLLNRRNVPSIASLEKICDGLGITLAQFFSYGGEMPDLSASQKALLDTWNSLNDIEKGKAEAYIQGLLDNRQENCQ